MGPMGTNTEAIYSPEGTVKSNRSVACDAIKHTRRMGTNMEARYSPEGTVKSNRSVACDDIKHTR